MMGMKKGPDCQIRPAVMEHPSYTIQLSISKHKRRHLSQMVGA